jgi:hypothetical protein
VFPVRYVLYLCVPYGSHSKQRVLSPCGGGGGKNTSTVIPARRKRRRKGNPVVSDEIVMYGYESSATLTTARSHYKLQTRPLVRKGAPRRRTKQFSGKIKEKVKSFGAPTPRLID